jgi:hypothetical protein
MQIVFRKRQKNARMYEAEAKSSMEYQAVSNVRRGRQALLDMQRQGMRPGTPMPPGTVGGYKTLAVFFRVHGEQPGGLAGRTAKAFSTCEAGFCV